MEDHAAVTIWIAGQVYVMGSITPPWPSRARCYSTNECKLGRGAIDAIFRGGGVEEGVCWEAKETAAEDAELGRPGLC